MGAVSILPDPTVEFSDASLPSGLLATMLAFASLIIGALALAGAAIEVRDHRRQIEYARIVGIANAAFEGLLLCNDQHDRHCQS